jgi:hypothetical protein
MRASAVNVLRKDELDQRFPGLIDRIVKEAADGRVPHLSQE